MSSSDRIPSGARVSGAIYAAFWRWHFHAGLLILPILLLMALTGGLYLFRNEIDGLIYRPLLVVEHRSGSTTPEAWVAAARSSVPGRVTQITVPADLQRSARVVIEQSDGSRRAVFIDPHDAHVLGAASEGGLMQIVKRLHSLEIAGPVGNMLVEVVAGWTTVMLVTGVVLWWPRGQSGGVVTLRATPRHRVFWRDLHAVTGVFAGAVILFLAITGMPWSAVWGQQVRKLTNEAGWGAPKPPAGAQDWNTHPAHKPSEAAQAVPWALQDRDMHRSDAGPRLMLSLDKAVARVEAAGLPRPYVLSIPAEHGKLWSASRVVGRAEDTRTLYLDPGTGAVVDDIGYRRYGPAAKAIQWGIAAHQGEEYGWVNRYIMLAGCVAAWLLGVSAIVIWWRRRPAGGFAAPPRPAEPRAYIVLALVIVPLGLFYPLVGVSLVVILSLDLLLRRLLAVVQPALESRK